MTEQSDYSKRMSLYTRMLAERAGDFRVEAIMVPGRPFQWRIYHAQSPDIVEILAPDYPAISKIYGLHKEQQRQFLDAQLEAALRKLKSRIEED